jgi:hypothetical protein
MRLLILTDDPSAATKLREPLEDIAAGDALEVKVIAPLRPESTLDPDDEDLARGTRERFTLPVTELSAG